MQNLNLEEAWALDYNTKLLLLTLKWPYLYTSGFMR